MAEENETVKPEKEPKYRKSAQMFAVAVAVLLCVVLMIDTFRRGGREDEKKTQPVPIDQLETARPSELDFQKRFKQERDRRQLQSAQVKPDAQKRTEIMTRLESQRDQQAIIHTEQTQAEKISVKEEWDEQERRRALNARRSKFNMKKASANLKLKPAGFQTLMLNGKDQSEITAEQNRIKNEIKRLEQMQSGAAPRSSGASFAPIKAQAPADDEESITVGRPRSEAKPKLGQKLMPTGSIIAAVLDQELMSDYTGPFRALTTHDVYDVTEKYIIIPKGSRITGRSLRITNVNEPIQARMGLTVRWLVLPNGKRITFEKHVAALDQGGVPATKGGVNYHFIAQFLGVAAYAMLSAETSRSGNGLENDTTFAGDVGESLREQFAPLAAKYLSLVPTITLKSGTPLKIFIEDDIYAYPWETLRKRLLKANRTAY